MPVLALHHAQICHPAAEDAPARRFWSRCYVFDPFGNKVELDQTE